MSRLDRHVNAVRTRLAAGTFLWAAAWTLLVLAGVVWLNVLVDRFLGVRLPKWHVWLFVGLGLSVALAVAYTVWRRPSRHAAAVAIDERLGLREKFSTALYVRPSADPFAAAMVRDAEATADNVSLYKRFPVRWPRMLAGTFAMAVVAALTGWLLGPHPLFANDDPAKQAVQAQHDKAAQDTKKLLDQALDKIAATPETPENAAKIEAARKEITDLKGKTIRDMPAAQRSALRAMQDMDAIKQKIKAAERFADAQNEVKAFKSMPTPSDPNSPIGQVQTSIGKGDFSKAVEELKDVVDKFDQMKQPDKEKAAADMKDLSKQLQKLAQDPAQQQKIKDELQKMGANQQQLNQLQQAVQQAAAGDKQAQQQVQQMANQIAQGMNQQQGLTKQQQQAISNQVQQAVKQMQGAANNQAAAQQMAQAAGQMAQAMQQAAQGQAAQANGNQGGQQKQPGGQQQPGQQGNQPGQQPGQQPGGQQPGGMAGAQQQMQQQLQQMQQAADDAAAVAQGQQNDGAGGQDGGNQPGQQGNQPGQPGNGQANGQPPQNGPGGQQWNNQNVQAAGGLRPKGQEAAFGVKRENAPSQTDEKGKLLANTFVKAMSQKGQSKQELTTAIESSEKDSTDEVEQERISRPAQGVVKRYFDDLKQGVETGQ